jgi:predicted transcriptional regulator
MYTFVYTKMYAGGAMESVTVRISMRDHAALQELARAESKSMTAMLSSAIRNLRAQHLMNETNAAFARLKQDPEAWKDYQDEAKATETTSADGLEEW